MSHLSKATLAQHLDEVEVIYCVLPEARNGPRWRSESASLAEEPVSRRLFWNHLKGKQIMVKLLKLFRTSYHYSLKNIFFF